PSALGLVSGARCFLPGRIVSGGRRGRRGDDRRFGDPVGVLRARGGRSGRRLVARSLLLLGRGVDDVEGDEVTALAAPAEGDTIGGPGWSGGEPFAVLVELVAAGDRQGRELKADERCGGVGSDEQAPLAEGGVL